MDRDALTCPSCGGELVSVDRSGVTIDACRSCRGIWLDRGELDKLLAREQGSDDDFLREVGGKHDQDRDERPHRKHKKKSLLGELLDF